MKIVLTIFALMASVACSQNESNADRVAIIDGVCFPRIGSIRSLDDGLVDIFLLKDEAQIVAKLEAAGHTVKNTTYSPPEECNLSRHNITGKEIGILIESKTIWAATFYFYFDDGVLVAVVPAIIPQK